MVSSRGDDKQSVLFAFRRLEGPGRYLAGVLDPRLTPFWVAALVAGWAIKSPKIDGAAALDRDLLDRGRAQRRPLLGLHSLSHTAAFHAPGVGAGRGPAGDHPRSQPLAPPGGGRCLLALHLLTPQGWPFALVDRSPPWDLTPLIPNAMSDPVLLFARIARAIQPDRCETIATGSGVT